MLSLVLSAELEGYVSLDPRFWLASSNWKLSRTVHKYLMHSVWAHLYAS